MLLVQPKNNFPALPRCNLMATFVFLSIFSFQPLCVTLVREGGGHVCQLKLSDGARKSSATLSWTVASVLLRWGEWGAYWSSHGDKWFWAMDQGVVDNPVTLVIRAPNQKYDDQTINCFQNWTVEKLKAHLSDVYPSKPVGLLQIQGQTQVGRFWARPVFSLRFGPEQCANAGCPQAHWTSCTAS